MVPLQSTCYHSKINGNGTTYFKNIKKGSIWQTGYLKWVESGPLTGYCVIVENVIRVETSKQE